jgi:hypothetical protein
MIMRTRLRATLAPCLRGAQTIAEPLRTLLRSPSAHCRAPS